ncbi:MAG: (Fe-S)-binding protein [Desulfuromonadales bacterium]|nr:(Fe-S)-binding protein [Desulfuromonadales bacterium]
MNHLEELDQEIKKCVKCGACRANCPAFSAWQREPAAARGKIAIAKHLVKGDIEPNKETYSIMSKCLLCGSCVEKCPNSAPTGAIVIAARELLAQKRGLTTFHKAVGEVIKRRRMMKFGALAGRIFGPLFFKKVPQTSGLRLRFPLPFIGGKRHVPQIARKPFLSRYPEVIPGDEGKPKILFFAGCMINFIYPEIGEAAVALLKHLGCTIIIPKEQGCCGLPGMSGGDLKTVKELAENNLAEFERYECDYIVTACASCGNALHKLYPGIVGKRNPELVARLKAVAEKTVDISVLLKKLGFNPKDTGAGEELKVTYHDPCHLRTSGITEEPRELISETPGVSFIEMENADKCCGLGGTFNVYHYDKSMDINEIKSRAAIKSGAEVLLTGCPGCMLQLSDGLKQHGSSMPVMHLVQVLARGIVK